MREENVSRIWFRNLGSRMVAATEKIRNPSQWNQKSSIAHLFYKVGSLRFRATWRGYYEKKGEDVATLEN